MPGWGLSYPLLSKSNKNDPAHLKISLLCCPSQFFLSYDSNCAHCSGPSLPYWGRRKELFFIFPSFFFPCLHVMPGNTLLHVFAEPACLRFPFEPSLLSFSAFRSFFLRRIWLGGRCLGFCPWKVIELWDLSSVRELLSLCGFNVSSAAFEWGWLTVIGSETFL